MSYRAVAFDLSQSSMASLREAIPDWTIDECSAIQAVPLRRDWNLDSSDLILVEMQDSVEEAASLCRLLIEARACSTDAWEMAEGHLSGRSHREKPEADAPLLVLVPCGQEQAVPALLKAGAHSCLMLPIHAKSVASMLVHVRGGNQPGRHTSSLENAQTINRWRDEGGEA